MDTTYSRGSPAGKPLQMALQKEICVSPVALIVQDGKKFLESDKPALAIVQALLLSKSQPLNYGVVG